MAHFQILRHITEGDMEDFKMLNKCALWCQWLSNNVKNLNSVKNDNQRTLD